MNKREAEKLMRKLAWDVCMLNEVPQQRDFDELEAEGYRLERVSIAGMDGFAVSKDGERVSFIAVPRKRNPGKKQSCTMYEWSDVWHFEKADDALVDGDSGLCMAHLSSIQAASLRNEICEGLERSYQEQLKAQREAEEKAADAANVGKLDELEQVREMLGRPDDVVVSRKREGACIWVIGNTKPMKDLLKELGFRWAPKKQGWYWKPQAA